MTTVFRPFHLVDFTFDAGNLYMTDADHTVVWSGNTYNARPFTVEGVPRTTKTITEGITITTQNVDRAVSAIIFNEVAQGHATKIYRTTWAAVNSFNPPTLIFEGMIDSIGVSEGVADASVALEIKNDFVKWEQSIPRHQFSASCNWVFKSTTPGCQYTGVASKCERSWARCVELSNQNRFRGFRHLPAIEDADIWWGKTQG
jgi:phage-related protein